MARPKTIISRADLARILGLSRARITQLSKRKGFPLRPDGLVDRIAAVEWYNNVGLAQQATKRGPKPASAVIPIPPAVLSASESVTTTHSTGEIANLDENPKAVETFAAAQARKESALADKHRMEAEKMKGTLIDATDAKRAWGGMISAARSRLLQLPAKAAVYVAASSDPAECQAILQKEIYEALTCLSQYDPAA